MALTIGAILALLGIAVAAFPFIRHRFFVQPAADEPATADGEVEEPAAKTPDELDAIYQAIRTLQLERELGNIPEGLYREQLNGYRIEAARLLRDLEQQSANADDWALEEEIRVARSGLYGGIAPSRLCPNCGRPTPISATHCPECGVALPTMPKANLPSTDEEGG